ncbi:MAG: FtsX-like permease family protein [Actinomycetota bacterium]
MRRLLREIGRAPVRILTSVLALALAVGAIGVFAIPTVSTSSLREAAERDGVPDLILLTTDTGASSAGAAASLATDEDAVDLTNDVVAGLVSLPNVVVAEPQIVHTSPLADGSDESLDLLGLDLAGQTMDVVRVEDGRRPGAAGEVLVTPGTAAIGTTIPLARPDGSQVELDVVGVGRTSFWSDAGLAFGDLDTAADVSGVDGANRIVLRTERDDGDSLGATSAAARERLAEFGVQLIELPTEIADGKHPIEADIDQISQLIGMLGIVAGLVGLVLLASTTNTLVVERSREVAVMRALGATDREVRRRLRRIALSIAAAATVIGLPLGVAISYTIARMVLDEFVGLTPGFAVSWSVLAASAAFALIGARIVAARSARRVTSVPLAEALRDREAVPFGRRWSERIASRWSGARLHDRLALRNALRHRGRSIAISLQLASAVAALMIVASMATTINDFNDAELDPIRWETESWVAGPGLDIDAGVADADPLTETAIEVEGEVEGWQVDVYGWEPETQMIDRSVSDGRWFAGTDEAVVSAGFAERVGIDIGDRIDVGLASGIAEYDVVGLHGNRGREVYTAREPLAAELGTPGLANRVYSLDDEPAVELAGVVGSVRFDDLDGDDSGRTAILLIFGAIGVVVVSVAGLAVMSGLAVNLHERRIELAAMRAIGARRRDLFGVLVGEVVALATVGVGVGLVGGHVGARAITRSFEASNAVEIGFTFADRAIPAVVGTVLVLTLAVTGLMVRRVGRRSPATTLRGAS